jgi:hypothetical protein
MIFTYNNSWNTNHDFHTPKHENNKEGYVFVSHQFRKNQSHFEDDHNDASKHSWKV